ncbi:hypothetical protein JCM10296v2_002297 [Rhodotorula toruloides]
MTADLSLEDAFLILELQKADIAQLSTARKGKSTSPNQEVVVLMSTTRSSLGFIAAATATDATILEALLEEERLARQDHELALRLAANDHDSDDDDAVSYRSAAPLHLVASTSTAGPSYPRSLETCSLKEAATCVICMEDFKSSETIPVYCRLNHRYCRACLRDLFLAAAKDESLFPPRCDGSVIPISLVQPHLSHDELANHYARMREYTTANRLYCVATFSSSFPSPLTFA